MARTKQIARRSTGGKAPCQSTGGKAPRQQLAHTSKINALQSTLRKQRCYCPGAVALRDIHRYQKSTDLLLPKLPFQRWMREIAHEMSDSSIGVPFGYRF